MDIGDGLRVEDFQFVVAEDIWGALTDLAFEFPEGDELAGLNLQEVYCGICRQPAGYCACETPRLRLVAELV
ncbi:hypothetical protein KJ605_02865 [Patescibacteria group bacterium]|nr:hypothetical protein [Patescibacteria group bacterium]